jgi:hypothetical protein
MGPARRRGADRVANMLDFPSGSAFRNTCQRYLGATPGEIRTEGGASFVMRSLLERVRAGTESAEEDSEGDAPAVTPDESPALAS